MRGATFSSTTHTSLQSSKRGGHCDRQITLGQDPKPTLSITHCPRSPHLPLQEQSIPPNFPWSPPLYLEAPRNTRHCHSHRNTHICNSYTPTIHYPRTSQFATAILTLPYRPQESLHLPSHFLQEILTHTHDLHQISYALSLSHRYTHTRLSSHMGLASHTHTTLHTLSAP